MSANRAKKKASRSRKSFFYVSVLYSLSVAWSCLFSKILKPKNIVFGNRAGLAPKTSKNSDVLENYL